MKSFMQWVANNAALTLLLGAELFCLIFGFIWVVKLTFENDEKPFILEPEIENILIIAEENQSDLANAEMEVYSLSEKAHYKLLTTSREEAIQEFGKKDGSILILSSPLNSQEIAEMKILPSRLPIAQGLIDDSTEPSEPSPIYVRDNQLSSEEAAIANFLDSNSSQDIVYQKMKNKVTRSLSKNG